MKVLCMAMALPLLVGLVGCQSYPKKPSMPSFWDGMEEINKVTPSELSGVRYTVVKFDHKKLKNEANIPALPQEQAEQPEQPTLVNN